MTSASFGTCADCGRPRKPNEDFCECGALFDYSVPASTATEPRTNGKAAAAGVAVAAPQGAPPSTPSTEQHEWPPSPPHMLRDDYDEVKPQQFVRLEPCSNCGQLNPRKQLVCWSCKQSTKGREEAAPRSGRIWWRTVLLLPDKQPLRAGQHEYPKQRFDRENPRDIARGGLIIAGAALLAAVLVIAVIKAWPPTYHNGKRVYNASRERLFPRFTPHHPSSVWPPQFVTLKKGTIIKRKNGKPVVLKTEKTIALKHPAADAFDRDLSTYWLSRTPRQVWDNLRINFKPAIAQFNDVVVFGGDPTAKTIVPRHLQMTFFRWEPHPDLVAGPVRPVHQPGDPVVLRSETPDECKVPFPVRLPLLRPSRGEFCVLKDGIKVIDLLNTPAEQRFSIGTQRDVAQIVITVRGTHRSTLPHAHAALTDVEFFDRH